ncbi:MAG: alpha/beta fold hydrolase [Gaiellaceae bacterium]
MRRPTLLLLHAFPLDARMWEAQEPAFEAEGYPVLAPNLPGREPETTFGAWAERVLGVVDGPFVPVGISMGGYLAFELWRQAGERIPALVLADTKAGADTPEARAARDEQISLLGETGFDPFWEGLAPKLFGPAADPELVASARAIAAEQPITHLVATLEALRNRPDSRETLATIDVPTLVIVGELDALTPPSESEAMVAALPRARLVTLAGAGHLTPLERPEEFNKAVLDFLAGNA